MIKKTAAQPLVYSRMKTFTYIFLCLIFFTAVSCQKEEEVAPDAAEGTSIRGIQVNGSVSKNAVHQIDVTIVKPTPCHEVQSVKVSTSGTTVNYNFILENTSVACAQVLDEETVTVTFTPESTGTYTLNFLINGKLHESRQVVVTN